MSWDEEVAPGWYDRGGWLKPGPTDARNASGVAEMVQRSRDYMRKRYGDDGQDPQQ